MHLPQADSSATTHNPALQDAVAASEPAGRERGPWRAELAGRLAGVYREDVLTRTLYATDASIYEILPDAVVQPKHIADVVATVEVCRRYGVPITARGGGTGLHGGAVNRGVQLDFARFMNRILEIDPQRRIARVEPGVVLDELNAELKRYGLHFAADVATSSRATLGGMIANNSCGARSILYGRTVDHVLALDMVLSDGSRHTWGRDVNGVNALARRCDAMLDELLTTHADEIAKRFPRVLRSNGGYALDRLRREGGRITTERLLSGSEGTLGLIVGATLNLEPLPRCKALVVLHYAELAAAFHAVPHILAHKPAAIELVDKYILDAALDNPAMLRKRWFLEGDPAATLTVEFYEDDPARLARRIAKLQEDVAQRGVAYAWPVLTDPAQQEDVWAVRKAGTGLLMSRPGDAQPYDFIDDTSVDPAVLGPYMVRLRQLLVEEGAEQAGYYGHASVGVIHVRPALNLKTAPDVERLRRISERVARLVVEYGGAITGEHGDGIVRSEWLAKQYGPKISAAFQRIKQTFDPENLFNPGKIVAPLPMDGTLRYGAGYRTEQPPTLLDFSAHGGIAGLAEMCSGLGVCRQRLVGTMCPSYMATGDERHTTRARANALRAALSNKGLLNGLDDPALDEVMDLCLSCKACKTECPTGTDMTKLKAEWLHHRHERSGGPPVRSRLIAASVDLARWGSHFAPLSNWVLQSRVTRVIMEHLFGLDRRVPPPRFAHPTFREWFERHTWERLGSKRHQAEPTPAATDRKVIYFVDTWTNFYQPGVGRAAVRVLEALGYEVLVLPTQCCGRPLLSKGLLSAAKDLAGANTAVLGPLAERGLCIVGTEPSCISALTDELPELVRTATARRIAAQALDIETFVAAELRARPDALHFRPDAPNLLYHGHCHQKALTGTVDAVALLQACTGGRAREINSGCCGMAGSFGHELEHYEVARAVGEQRLFPAVRGRGDAEIAISGFSCRHQIEHHTEVRPRHVIEYVADALAVKDAT